MKKRLLLLCVFPLMLLTGCQNNESVAALKKEISDLSAAVAMLKENIAIQNDLLEQRNTDYIFDEYGKFITFNELKGMLKEKYFPEAEYSFASDRDFILNVNNNAQDIDYNELFAKLYMLYQEYQNYSYYYVAKDNLTLGVKVLDQDAVTVVIPYDIMQNARYIDFDGFDQTGLDQGYFDLNDEAEILDLDLIHEIIASYETNQTYAGYVLPLFK